MPLPLYHDAIATPEFNSQWWEALRRGQRPVRRRRRRVRRRQGHRVGARLPAAIGAVLLTEASAGRADRTLQPRPVPRYEIFAQLPWRRRLVQGMLGADLIGFQRQADATNFLRACGRLALNPEGAAVDMPPAPNPDNTRDAPEVGDRWRVRVGVFPISIDFARFDDLARRDDVRARAQEIRSQLGDPQILLLGVDRLDYTKGSLHRLRAYEQLLADGLMGPPGSVMVQIATPTRERVEQYKALLREVEAMVGPTPPPSPHPRRPPLGDLLLDALQPTDARSGPSTVRDPGSLQ